ncbi:MAG: hypothetical protein AABY22_12140 [Nanoarchaeota archaeon]
MEAKKRLVIAKWSIVSILLIYVSPILSNFMNGYVSFFGTFGTHLTRFLAYFIFIWVLDFSLNKILELP